MLLLVAVLTGVSQDQHYALLCDAVCCCVFAVCCSVLQRVEACCSVNGCRSRPALCVAACLQYVAVCLQCVAACCCVLQCGQVSFKISSMFEVCLQCVVV